MSVPTSFAILVTAMLLGGLAGSAGAEEATLYESLTQAEPAPANTDSGSQSRQASPAPGMPAPHWQQAPRWRVPQQYYGQFPRQYPPARQYYPSAAPATPAAAPRSEALEQAQQQLAEKGDALEEASNTIEQLHSELRETRASETRLSDRLDYSNREQHALRLQVTELVRELEEQRVLQNSKLTEIDRQLATLQTGLQAVTKALVQARASTGVAGEAPDTTRQQIKALRDALGKLEAALENQ